MVCVVFLCFVPFIGRHCIAHLVDGFLCSYFAPLIDDNVCVVVCACN